MYDQMMEVLIYMYSLYVFLFFAVDQLLEYRYQIVLYFRWLGSKHRGSP